MNSGMSPGNNVAKSYYDNMPWGHGPAPIPMRPVRGANGNGGNNTVTGWYWPNHITPPSPTNRPGSRMRRGGRTRRMRRGGRTRRR